MPEFDSTIEYRDCPGFPGYKVGSDGSIWSCLKRRGLGRGTRSYLSDTWKPLNPGVATLHGHTRIGFRRGGKTYIFLIHRVVLEAFVGPRPAGMQCRHFPDRDPTNNALSNLQWGTAQENQDDRIRHGTICQGEKVGNAKLTAEQVLAIRAEYASGGWTYKLLGKKYGVSDQKVYQIINRKAWAHI